MPRHCVLNIGESQNQKQLAPCEAAVRRVCQPFAICCGAERCAAQRACPRQPTSAWPPAGFCQCGESLGPLAVAVHTAPQGGGSARTALASARIACRLVFVCCLYDVGCVFFNTPMHSTSAFCVLSTCRQFHWWHSLFCLFAFFPSCLHVLPVLPLSCLFCLFLTFWDLLAKNIVFNYF